jgi:hypothetical protein
VYDVRDSPELLTNVDTLIEVSEGVESWLCHVLQCIDSFACPPLQSFLHPSEGPSPLPFWAHLILGRRGADGD